MFVMENIAPSRFVGSEIHGFRSMEDLDVGDMFEEAKTRWLRPNEIHAILSNYRNFTVSVKPVNLPKSGRIVLFDRKVLRNFRKDGYSWKKKKDGKTVKEAHEHLKVGNEERIHVYYAHGEDNPTFVRRCYWLLDKSLEHIVLVHYRETQEVSPSISSSAGSQPSASRHLLEESESAVPQVYNDSRESLLAHGDSMTIKSHEQRLHEINTLDWDELLVPDESQKLITPQQEFEQYQMENYKTSDNALSTNKTRSPESSSNSFSEPVPACNSINYYNIPSHAAGHILSSQSKVSGPAKFVGGDSLEKQDSFGRWMNSLIADSPESIDNEVPDSSILCGNQLFDPTPMMDNRSFGQIFNITDVSPTWAFSNEQTKILVVGLFNEGQLPRTQSELFLACGDSIVPTEIVQSGVFRSFISPKSLGLSSLYLTLDGQTPISQVLTFEVRSHVPAPNGTTTLDNNCNWEELQLHTRLAHLLFSSSKKATLYSTRLTLNSIKEAKDFARKTSHVSNSWVYLTKLIKDTKMSFPQAKDTLFELTLQNRVQEWLLEKVATGCKTSERDEQGQGVLHLCAILGYTWVVHPFSCSSLSLDYRDKFGWTAIHWAAFYGREKMVAALLSAGAKPNLVTDPTPENPGGSTAADLASKNGYDGLAAYLGEKALVTQFNDMTLAGNVSGSLQTNTIETIKTENLSEEELNLKETLAAYRTAADAAARIQVAFRERTLKLQVNAADNSSIATEIEARNLVAAMKIQHAFRNKQRREKIEAAARIQCRFRTWKIRKDFLNMRHQAIKIQSIFRGFQARKQYRKIIWSVGVLEKVILRWRLKRKGIRGLDAQTDANSNQESDVEEDFFKASRKQAEERVERSVVRVQAMFRSKQAQEQYRRMKMEHNKAMMEYEGLLHPDTDML